MANPDPQQDFGEVTNPSLQTLPGGGGGSRWTLERMSALLSLVMVILGGAYGVFTVWTQAQQAYMQAKQNADEIKSIQRSVGFVQLDVATMCVQMTGDASKCKTSGGRR